MSGYLWPTLPPAPVPVESLRGRHVPHVGEPKLRQACLHPDRLQINMTTLADLPIRVMLCNWCGWYYADGYSDLRTIAAM